MFSSSLKTSVIRRAGPTSSIARNFSGSAVRKAPAPEAGDLDAKAAEQDFGELKTTGARSEENANKKEQAGSVKQPSEKSLDPADDGYGVASGGEAKK